MEKQRSSRVSNHRQPLGDATSRVNNSGTDKGTGPRQQAQGQTDPMLKSKQAPRGHSTPLPVARPAQSEIPEPSMVEPGHADKRHSAMTQDSYTTVEGKRASKVSNASSAASSVRPRKTHIGPWQLGKTLGKGSSARVRAARHRVTHQFAAVKIVAKSTAHLTQAGSLAQLDKIESSQPVAADGVRRMPLAIEREVAVLKLIEHPNIVKLYDIWENREEIYLVLEYVEKGDLFEFINWQGRLREEEAIYYFRQIMSAIQYCHSLNICHRDLKPENILLCADGQVKVADFGMAALHQSPSHHLHTACGSPHYAAPELLKQLPYKGESTDLWSMGVILFALLAGRLPFDEPRLQDMLAKAKDADYEMPDFLSLEAQDLIDRILQVEPHHRISMAQMWRHALIRKYDYLDDLNKNGGQPPDIRRDAHLTALGEAEIDPQILRQLRSVWHAFTEEQLKAKLLSHRPNDEKLFYRLLHEYREAQMENYNNTTSTNMVHSKSDFHHLKPPNLGKRISTCQFTQAGRKGHVRNVSRFTVISNVAETESGTVQSYDPYNASRVLHPCNSQASHAKITIHRNSPEPGAQAEPSVVSHSYRSYKTAVAGSPQPRKAMNSQQSGTANQLYSPPGTMSSLQSSRVGAGTPRVRPTSRHKRGVDFSAVRKRPNEARRRSSDRSRKAPASIAGDNTTYGRDNLSPSSPQKKKPEPLNVTTSKTMAEVMKPRDDSVIWNEELKQLGHKIAEHCDEAFRSSLLSSASGEEFDGRREATPLSFTLESSPAMQSPRTPPTTVSPPPRHSSRHWESRPLPPIPREAAPTPEPKAFRNFFNGKHSRAYAGAEGANSQQAPDRRVVSAPVHSRHGGGVSQLPSIYENTPDGRKPNDSSKGRIVSAPADSPAGMPNPHDNRGLDYLARVETSIRVVNSPTDVKTYGTYDPVQAPQPLNVRKKYSRGVSEPQDSSGRCSRLEMREPSSLDRYQESNVGDGGSRTPSQGSEALGGSKKKRPTSWFKRSSKESVNEPSSSAGEKTSRFKEGSFFTNANHANRSSSQTTSETLVPPSSKKKGFSLSSFWKTNKPEPTMSLAGPALPDTPSPESRLRVKAQASRTAATHGTIANPFDDVDTSGRKIEVHQSWLARFFRVKPATRHLCFTIPRRRARQEIAILLRGWRKYGMRNIAVDKARDIVFGRIGPKNYLNIKEVAFAAEIMTVIEHGKRNHLSIVRFTQEKGAASSFHKVVDTMNTVFGSRNLLVTDERKAKMMIKTLNS